MATFGLKTRSFIDIMTADLENRDSNPLVERGRAKVSSSPLDPSSYAIGVFVSKTGIFLVSFELRRQPRLT